MHISQLEKEKFIRNFNEDDFREFVVRRLFKSLGYKDGRDTCGPEEFGKDAIFIDVDKLGIDNFIAIQTKCGNINLSGDPSNNLHELVAQVRTALNQPHVCSHTKKKVLPIIVYVAASGKINQAARNYIADKVDDPRIRFLDRDDLIAKIDDSCPEIWSNIVANVSPYLKALSDKVEDLSILSDKNPIHSTLGAFAAASDQRFVDVRLGYHNVNLNKRAGHINGDLDYQEISGTSLLSGGPVRAFLVGDAGSGKTTLLIRLAYLIAKQSFVSLKNHKIPIFIRAHELVSACRKNIYAVLENIVLKIQELPSCPFSIGDLEAGRIVLLIDGLDELSVNNDRQTVIDFLRMFMDQYQGCSVVLGSRPYSSISKLEGLDAFRRYRISPLNMQDASNMVNGIHGGGAADAEWRKELLRKLDAVHGIELNPLLVTVFAISSGNEKRDIPANITELFSKFTELMLGRWDEKKGLSQQYQSKVKDHLLSLFAYKLQLAGSSHFSRNEFIEFVKVQLTSMNLEPDLHVMIGEILDRSGLIRGVEDELEFKHHLLQEYFASRGIPDISKVKEFVNSEWWRNSIVFYFGSQPSAINDLLDVATSALTIREESYMTIGLALQACYLSKLDERIEVWKWVIEAASCATTEFIGEKKESPITNFLAAYLEARDSVALGGLEKSKYGVYEWVLAGRDNGLESELRRFWYATALIELGEFETLQRLQDEIPFSDDMLATAIHFSCYFSSEVRSLSVAQKERAALFCRRLDSKVAPLRIKIIEELKGELLEYQRSGVVALDAPEPSCDKG